MNDFTHVLGVDVSKDTLALCLMDRHERLPLIERAIPNDIRHIHSSLAELPVTAFASLRVAIEPTGPYWLDMANTALDLGCQVMSASPRAAKLFLRSVNLRAKTDKLDAKGIALYAASMDLKPYQPKAEELRQLDDLLALRRKLSSGIAYYSRLAALGGVSSDVASGMMAFSKTQLSEMDRRVREVTKAFEPARKLEKVPGFGTVVSAALTSKLVSIPFRSSDAFVAYVGLDTKVRESGKRRGRRALSRNGDAELRRLLYLAAQATIRVKGSPFADIYQRHRDRGLTTTEAICVVARKMARTAWSIVRYDTNYDPNRVLQDRH
jgi:transposase